MLSVVILLGAVLFFYFIGYRLWAKFLDEKVIQPDDNRPTPAYAQRDDVGFVPAKTPILFGHHFASIAGAGPNNFLAVISGVLIILALFVGYEGYRSLTGLIRKNNLY